MKFLIILLFLITTLYSSECNSFENGNFELGSSRGSLDGYIQVGKDGATKLDLKSDLGLNKSKNSLQTLLNGNYKNSQFSFKMTKFKISGKKKLTSDILYNSEHFAKASIIKDKLDLVWTQLKYRYKISDELNIGADLNGIKLYSYIDGNSYKKTLIMPSLAINYTINLADELKLITKTSLTPIGSNRYTEGYLGLAFKLGFSNCSYLHIGYQVSQFQLDSENLNANLNYKGIYAGIKAGF